MSLHILGELVASPTTDASTDNRKQYAQQAEDIVAGHECAQPTAADAADGDTHEDHIP
jgi:hypothetical protein